MHFLQAGEMKRKAKVTQRLNGGHSLISIPEAVNIKSYKTSVCNAGVEGYAGKNTQGKENNSLAPGGLLAPLTSQRLVPIP